MLYCILKHKQTHLIIMFKIEWIPKAFRQLIKIKLLGDRRKIEEKVGLLESWPECPELDIKKLVQQSGYRLHCEDWRILFNVDNGIQIIEIQAVKRRNERTY